MNVVYSEAVLSLMARDEEFVPAAAIAPIVKMNPGQIVKYAKEGMWPREICNYLVTGNRVKFARVDFLRKGGWLNEVGTAEIPHPDCRTCPYHPIRCGSDLVLP